MIFKALVFEIVLSIMLNNFFSHSGHRKLKTFLVVFLYGEFQTGRNLEKSLLPVETKKDAQCLRIAANPDNLENCLFYCLQLCGYVCFALLVQRISFVCNC